MANIHIDLSQIAISYTPAQTSCSEATLESEVVSSLETVPGLLASKLK